MPLNLLLLASALGGVVATAPEPQVDPGILQTFNTKTQQRVLVRVSDPLANHTLAFSRTSKDDRARAIQRRRENLAATKLRVLKAVRLATKRSFEAVYGYPAFHLFAADVDRAQLKALLAQPEVRAVFADRQHRPHLDTSLPHAHVPKFHEDRGQGRGVSVAILDSPVRYGGGHFGSCSEPGAPGCAFLGQLNFTSQSIADVMRFEDRYLGRSHGTNVAAIAHGVAPGAGIIGLSVFQGNSAGSLSANNSDVLQALNWVAFNAGAQKIVAANMSLGSDRSAFTACNFHSYAGPIRTLFFENDVLTVVSSGNDATQNAVSSPACINLAVTVAAHFDTETARYAGYDCYQENPRDQEMACFSNLSGLVDLVAPGVFIEAGGYKLSGTSMAAPHVTGAVALKQGEFLSTQIRLASAYDTHQSLMLAGGRIVHIDGRKFPRLDLASSGQWDHAQSFGLFIEQGADNRFSNSPSAALTMTTTVSGAGFDLAGAYLFLELNHEQPETLLIRLTSPTGRSAQITLPGAQANFTGVVGRQFDVQALRVFDGEVADGPWTLSVQSPAGGPAGHLMNANLMLRRASCNPSCEDAGCGDDGCGRACDQPHCEINQRCYADGSVPADNPCLMCDANSSRGSWGRSGAGCQIEGACYTSGTQYDTIPCMSCRPEVSTSSWSPNAGVCVVAGTCIEAGTRREGSPCRGCDPDQDPRAYSRLSNVACDDEDACTTEDMCTEGRCAGAPVVCPAPGPCELTAACAASSGDCVTTAKPDGTTCGDQGICEAGVCGLAPKSDEGGGCSAAHPLHTSRAWAGLLLIAACGLMRRRR